MIHPVSRYEEYKLLQLFSRSFDDATQLPNGEYVLKVETYFSFDQKLNAPSIEDYRDTKSYRVLKRYVQDEIFDVDEEQEKFSIINVDSKRYSLELRRLHIRCYHAEGEPAQIEYDVKKGLVKIADKEIKLQKRNKKIFSVLYERRNHEIDKGIIWRAAGRRGRPTSPDEIIDFNTYITNLRRALGGISPKQLRMKKNVELWTTRQITDVNDLNLTNMMVKKYGSID